MSKITKISVTDSAVAIWDYDPTLFENRIGAGYDYVNIVRTLIVKIRASPTREEVFERCQQECKISPVVKLSTHSNIRWGSSLDMLQKAIKLADVSPSRSEYSEC
jgi:hypothetical protein